MKALIIGFLCMLSVVAQAAADPVQRIQQLVDYLGADYREAVADGKITDPSEYAEMQNFAAALIALAKDLPDAPERQDIQSRLHTLQTAIESRADPFRVASLTAELRRLLISSYGLAVAPAKAPDLQRGAALYAENCVQCHGASGQGDGPLATTLDPKPTDFTDPARYRERTLYGLFSTITHGVEGTSMKSWAGLPESDRWALAFHVGSLGATAISDGKPAGYPQDIDRETLTTSTPEEIAREMGERGAQWAAWLRQHPQMLWEDNKASGIEHTLATLDASRQAYLRGEADLAHELAIDAYLDGFEKVESNLDAVDSQLRHRIEEKMTRYRGMLENGLPGSRINAAADELKALLNQAHRVLERNLLSSGAAFSSALLILLREGLEAILVIAALGAFLIKTGRREGLRYLYYGTGGALVAGLLTWLVSSYLIEISGAGRELTEALAALFAAAMLFYVGFWLHSKTSASQWRAFIQDSVKKSLGKGHLWGLTALAFVAVYRELFETVLFYQALWLQTGDEGREMIVGGFVTAAGGLTLLAWLVLRFSARLPLRQFFSLSSVLMFILAVVFAGKGIAALQEVGLLSSRHVDFPSMELLGIYPNLEGLSVQLALIVIALFLVLRRGRRQTPTT